MKHKTPIRRSAFTYCEDELPSGMNLGKEKYGGPFTTEQVEDVKAFFSILCLLVTLGPVFISEIARNSLMYGFSSHIAFDYFTLACGARNFNSSHNDCGIGTYFISQFNIGTLTELLIVFVLPVYIYFLRPYYHTRFVPNMLKRIGFGMTLLFLSLLSLFAIDAVAHKVQRETVCFLSLEVDRFTSDESIPPNHISRWYLVLTYFLNALGYILFYTSTYEFICAQSPHAMKGLLIGTFFAVKGIFQLIGSLLSFPFVNWTTEQEGLLLSCGSIYYLVNAAIALTGLFIYICISKRYKYRERDEPDNIYRYAEEYYSKYQ